MSFFTISINGQKAVNAGYAFCAGYCYKQLVGGIAQLEVVVDDDGMYNGNPNKWVDVSYIKTGSNVETVLNMLKEIGFDGCPCIISKDFVTGCMVKSKNLCCCII